MNKWLTDFDQTIANTADPIVKINFKDYERLFLTQILSEFSAESDRLEKLPYKNQERMLCSNALIRMVGDILAEIRLMDSSNMITNSLGPYLSMELVYLKLLKIFSGEDNREKNPSSDYLLNRTSIRILSNLEWAMLNIEGTKLEWFKSKIVEYVDQASLSFKYYASSVASQIQTLKLIDPLLPPIHYLSSCLRVITLQHKKKLGVEDKSVGETVQRNIPRVDMLSFYEDQIDKDHKMFMDFIEMNQEIDYRKRTYNEKHSALKVLTDRDMHGETVNLRQITDSIESRTYKYYKAQRAEYFQEPGDTFHDKTYPQIVCTSTVMRPKTADLRQLQVG